MSADRKTGTWFVVIFCVLSLNDVVISILRLRALLLHGYHLPLWYVVTLAIHLLSCPLICVATWFLWSDEQSMKTRSLVWGSAFLVWAISRAVWFWHVRMTDCLIVAFALGQFWFYLTTKDDSTGEDQALAAPEESQ